MEFSHREPLTMAAGDSLAWHRLIPDFLPSAGWNLLYEVRGPQLPEAAIQFQSTPDATNTVHEITVDADVTANWLPGDSVLVGYAVNAGTGERKEIWNNELIITPNLGTATNNVDTRTHAQKMIELIECQLEQLAKHALQDTNIQQVEIRRAQRMELEKQLAWNKEIRANEIAVENVRNGRPSGQRVKPVMNIVGAAPPYGYGWPFIPRS